MRINIAGGTIPYPMSIMMGYLRISGVSRLDACSIIDVISSQTRFSNPSEESMLIECRRLLEQHTPDFADPFLKVIKYNWLLRHKRLPHIILVIEGASATGKSMLALNLIPTIAATRVVTTDSIRQILRTQSNKADVPELFCHTYQAHKYKQIGLENLPPSIRGYFAQVELLTPSIQNTIQRVIKEGVAAVIEGVHIIPGSLRDLSQSIIEVLVHPDDSTHWGMFMNKAEGSGLKTVSANLDSRQLEYSATREIQDYFENEAKINDIPIVNLESYEETENKINGIIFEHLSNLVESVQSKTDE